MKKIKKNWKAIGRTLIIGFIAFPVVFGINPTDRAIRSKVVKLVGENGTCSGEMVRARSGVSYILTAAHCREIGMGEELTAITEDGRKLVRHIIAEDPASDLLLLEGIPGESGFKLSDNEAPHQHIRTFTHGRGMDTYKTEGAIVQKSHVEIPIGLADTPELEAICLKAPKYKIGIYMSFFGMMKVCELSLDEIAMTAPVEPGSSGGPVMDDGGRLIGVVSASGEGFGYIVPLDAMRAFLANY